MPKKKENYHFVYISNKIIFKFFNSIVGIPYGNESGIIFVPNIIKNSNTNIKKAFLQGIFMFDGGVDYRNGYVSLVSRSMNLIREVNKILNKINLKPDYINLNPDRCTRYRIIFQKKRN